MPLIGALSLVIQFCFAYHALKTGRPYWWLFVIMAFPVMGCVIYYFVEVFPGSREQRSAHKTARKIVKALQPDAELKKRAEELTICGSVDNRLALAEECLAHKMFPEAIRLYESCAEGAFAADGSVLYGLAYAAVEGGEWAKADAALAKLRKDLPDLRAQEVGLLGARSLAGQGRIDEALAAFRALLPQFVGLEARYRYGELLSKLGQHEAANHVFNEVITHSKRFASSLDEEQEWVVGARRAISSP